MNKLLKDLGFARVTLKEAKSHLKSQISPRIFRCHTIWKIEKGYLRGFIIFNKLYNHWDIELFHHKTKRSLSMILAYDTISKKTLENMLNELGIA